MKYYKDKDDKVCFRIAKSDYEQLQVIAKKSKISTSLLVRNILTEYLAQRRSYEHN